MSSSHAQQPLQRTVGQRKIRDGQPLTESDRAAMSSNARYRTRAPKGIYIYSSHEEMAADRLRWTVDAIVATQQRAMIEFTRPATWENGKTSDPILIRPSPVIPSPAPI